VGVNKRFLDTTDIMPLAAESSAMGSGKTFSLGFDNSRNLHEIIIIKLQLLNLRSLKLTIILN